MILALLVAKFPGVRKDGLNMLARLMALQTETEDEAKAAVERLTRDGVDAFVRDFRSDVDKEVSDGTRTFEENLRRKSDLVEKQSEPRTDANRVHHVGAASAEAGKFGRGRLRTPANFAGYPCVGAYCIRPIRRPLWGRINMSGTRPCRDVWRANAIRPYTRVL